ncbi:hypothetical protein [Brevibacillus borstelensis]|uniref:hypothetical protein n=1 Tax=Brevibacillus borstelensis TaxID=45462 RepID=UPI0030BA5229
MWLNPFPRKEHGKEAVESMSLTDAQSFVNIVVLEPSFLPEGTELANVTARKETDQTRSSVRFEISGGQRALRVKQFFYDWSIPGIYADSNLVTQGKPFVWQGIAGFLGKDYKGHAAACYARWFTQVEISVLAGQFDEEELRVCCGGLVPAVPEAVQKIGQKAFALTSHTSRFHVPKWTSDDPINRVNWKAADETNPAECFHSHGHLPPIRFRFYVWDSVGTSEQPDGIEYQILLRDSENFTDCIWVWCSPKSLKSPFPEFLGYNIGKRTKWNMEIVKVEGRKVIVGKQAASVPGWQLHWEQGGYDYHIHMRANDRLRTDDVLELAARMVAGAR